MKKSSYEIIFLSFIACSSCSVPIWTKEPELKPYQPRALEEERKASSAKPVKIASKKSPESLSVKGSIELNTDKESDQKYLEFDQAQTAKVQEPEQLPTGEVEITWLVPESEVEGFIVDYGYTEKIQDQKVKISTKDLTKVKDATNGDVYKYILKNIPSDKALYIKIAAFKGNTTSEFSPVLHVK